MKKLLLLTFYILLVFTGFSQSPGKITLYPITSTNGMGTYNFWLFKPYDSLTAIHKHPLMISMNGAGEVGSTNFAGGSIGALVQAGAPLQFFNAYYGWNTTFVVMIPNKPGGAGNWEGQRVMDMINWAKANLNSLVDTTQMYVTGLSLGGGGVLNYISISAQNASRIAAAAAFAPLLTWTAEGSFFNNVYNTDLPLLTTGCMDDGTNNGDLKAAMDYLAARQNITYPPSGGFLPQIRIIRPTTGGHQGAWDLGFSTGHGSYNVDSSYIGGKGAAPNKTYVNNPNTYEWLLQFARPATGGGGNVGPTPDAGSNQTITLPTNSVNLDGSASFDVDGTIVNYNWVKTSGPGTPTITTPTNKTTTVTGLSSGTYVFTLTVTDNAAATASASVTITVNASFTWTIGTNVGANGGTLIKPYADIDLIGSDDRSLQKHKFMYDGTGYDPANGSLNIITGGLVPFLPEKQYPELYPDLAVKDLVYTDSIGNLTLLDFSRGKDSWDTSAQVHFTSIYASEISSEVGDTLSFYDIDFIFKLPPDQRGQALYSLYSTRIPFAKISTKNKTREWTSVLCNKTCRYVVVRGMLKQRVGYKTTPLFTEIAFYGTPTVNMNTVPRRTAGYTLKKYPAPPTFDNFVGTNIGAGQRVDVLAGMGTTRIYGSKSYWSTSTSSTDTSNEVYTYDHFLDWGPTQYAQLKALGKKTWWSIRGVSAGYNQQFGTGAVDIDAKTANPVTWQAWTREAQFAFYYAAKFGTVVVPTAKTPHWNVNTGNGLALLDRVEPGNEEEFYGVLPILSVNKMSAWYDGYEHRLGPNTGVKTADPNFILIYPGNVAQNISLVTTHIWLSQVTRTNHDIPWDIFNYHHYPSTIADNPTGTCADQVGATGKRAEKDQINIHNRIYIDSIYNMLDGDTTKKIINTETGYGNWATPATDPTFACNVIYDYGNSFGLLIPGLDSLQSKAVAMSVLESKLYASGLAGYNDYFFHNSSFGANTYTLFSSYGMTTGHDIVNFIPTTFFPWYYYHNSKASILKGYVRDSVWNSVLVDDTGLNVIRYKNVNRPDSVIWEVWKGTRTGTTLSSQNINIGAILGGTIRKSNASFVSNTPSSSTISASGTLTINVGEQPTYYAGRTTTIPIPPVVTVGPNQSFASNIGTITITGSAIDPDGTIASYLWSKVSGPTATIVTPSAATTNVTDLLAGTYVFRLTATDNSGNQDSKDVTIVVQTYKYQLNLFRQ